MTEDFQKIFAAMLEQGQEMARAFNPGAESFVPKGFEGAAPTMAKALETAQKVFAEMEDKP